MEAPLTATRGNSADGDFPDLFSAEGGHPDEEAQWKQEGAPLQPELRRKLKFWSCVGSGNLGGLSAPGDDAPLTSLRHTQIWAAVLSSWWLCLAVCISRSAGTFGEGPGQTVIIAAAVACTIFAGVLGPFQVVNWHQVGKKGIGWPGPGTKMLHLSFSPALVAKVEKTVKAIPVICAMFCVVFPAISVTLARNSAPTSVHHWVAAIGLVVLAPAQICVFTPAQPLAELIFAMPADNIRQLAAEIGSSTAATTDYEALSTKIYSVHTTVAWLSTTLKTIIIGTTLMNVTITALLVVVAVGPRPEDDSDIGGWYNVVFHPTPTLILATCTLAQAVWALAGPAQVTSACQQVGDAINGLRIGPRPSDWRVQLATPEQGHRIEILKRYMNELNRDQGLGFIFFRKRINYTLVYKLMTEAVSALWLLNGILLSILKVEGKEAPIEDDGIASALAAKG